MINFDDLYWLRLSLDAELFTAEIIFDPVELDSMVRGEIVSKEAITAKWVAGAEFPGDLIATTSMSGLIISQRVLESLAGLSGFRSVPVRLEDKNGDLLGEYYLLIIEGRCGPIDPSMSKIIGASTPERPIVKGLFFAEEDWDRSDFFMMHERTFFRFATKRAVDRLAKFGSDAVEYTRLSNFEQDPLGMEVIIDHQKKQGINKHEWPWSN